MYSVTSFLLEHPAAGLLALLGLMVPVAIHLWNRRPGQTVRVGSVRWLAATANRRLRNLRLEQLGLLLLRAAVLALLALAVAGPHWQRTQNGPPARGLVLLAPETLRPDVLPALRPGLDSLQRRGFRLRLFAPGFRMVSPQAWASPDSLAKLTGMSTASAPTPAAAAAPDNYWARARQAADSFPGQPLHIVAGTAQRHFSGPRPALPASLAWQPVPLPDSAVWVAGAALAGPNTLRVLVGRSREEATTFRVVTQNVAAAASGLVVAGLPGLRYQPAAGDRPATVRQPGQAAVPVLAGPLRVRLYADARHAESARYVRAALQAAAIGLVQGLEIRNTTPDAAFPADAAPDWLFWLAEKPAPASWLAQVQRGARLWQEATGPGIPASTVLDLTGLATAPAVPISRLTTTRIHPNAPTAETLWQDATGRPVLTCQRRGNGGLYQLATQLQPTWSGLPDSPALPELFLQLVRPATLPATFAAQDLRQLDARQLTGSPPVDSSSQTRAASSLPASAGRQERETTDLRAWAVLAAAILFGLERGLAARRAAVPSPAFSL